jgi:hypothetical protein
MVTQACKCLGKQVGRQLRTIRANDDRCLVPLAKALFERPSHPFAQVAASLLAKAKPDAQPVPHRGLTPVIELDFNIYATGSPDSQGRPDCAQRKAPLKTRRPGWTQGWDQPGFCAARNGVTRENNETLRDEGGRSC